jgi:hypothetical protein
MLSTDLSLLSSFELVHSLGRFLGFNRYLVLRPQKHDIRATIRQPQHATMLMHDVCTRHAPPNRSQLLTNRLHPHLVIHYPHHHRHRTSLVCFQPESPCLASNQR